MTMTLLLNRALVSRANLCLVSVFLDIVKDCPKMRNFPKIFLRSFENVAPEREWHTIRLYAANSRPIVVCARS